MRFGYCLPIFASPGPRLFRTPNVDAVDAADVIRLAREAEEIGFNSLWACDHLMLGRDNAVLEGWTVLATVAGATTTARLGLIHQANLHRPPPVHAKMTATLDQLSGGRFIFFFDTGTMAGEHVAYGLDWQSDVGDRVRQLQEALDIIKRLWTVPGPIDYTGRFYHVSQAEAAPRPAQAPHPPIWFADSPVGLLDLCARHGDGWNSTPAAKGELQARLDRLEVACERAGRASNDLEKSFETQVLIADNDDALRAKLRALADKPGTGADEHLPAGVEAYLDGRAGELPEAISSTWIIGTPSQARRRVRDLRQMGIDHLMLWFMDAPERTSMRRFMTEVAPGFQAG